MQYLPIIAGTLFVLGLMFSAPFRNLMWSTLQGLWQALRLAYHAIWVYSGEPAAFVFVLLIVTLLIVGVGVLTATPLMCGIGFLLAIIIFWLVWTPVGITLRFFGATKEVYAPWFGTAVFWLAATGLVGMMYPETISNINFIFFLLLTAIMYAGFCTAMSFKAKIFNWLIMFTVLGMLIIAGAKIGAPHLYKGVDRFMAGKEKAFVAWMHHSGLKDETYAATTQGFSLREVKEVYNITLIQGKVSKIEPKAAFYSKNTEVIIYNQERESTVYEGVNFVEVKFPNDKGNFVGQEIVWVQARYFRWEKGVFSRPEKVTKEDDFIVYGPGSKLFVKLPVGQITEKYIRFGKETRFDLHHNNNFEILPRHGKAIKVWKGDSLPKNYNFDFKVKAVNGLAALYAEIKSRKS